MTALEAQETVAHMPGRLHRTMLLRGIRIHMRKPVYVLCCACVGLFLITNMTTFLTLSPGMLHLYVDTDVQERQLSICVQTIEDTNSSRIFTSSKPYYRWGKTKFLKHPFHTKETFLRLEAEDASFLNESEATWILPTQIQQKRRNHDSVILEQGNGQYHLVHILGRYARSIEWLDLVSGDQGQVETTGVDPNGYPLNNLNHVSAVTVDSLDGTTKEVWLLCGFIGDTVGAEDSISYVRIVDMRDMSVRVGPKLPRAGGACTAAALEIDGPGTAPHLCSMGGTDGNHDTGTFLSQTSCYDRVQNRWHFVLGELPYALDHANNAVIPAGTCSDDDPARILLLNYRVKSFGDQRPEILAFDIPSNGWTSDQIEQSIINYHVNSTEAVSPWYLFANFSYSAYRPGTKRSVEDEVNQARDAGGLTIVNGGRHLLNFGGVHYWNISHYSMTKETRRYNPPDMKSHVRMLDVCSRQWSLVGDMGLKTFAMMTAASAELNIAVTCGGDAESQVKRNQPWCSAVRVPGVQMNNPQGDLSRMAPNFVAQSIIGPPKCSVVADV